MFASQEVDLVQAFSPLGWLVIYLFIPKTFCVQLGREKSENLRNRLVSCQAFSQLSHRHITVTVKGHNTHLTHRTKQNKTVTISGACLRGPRSKPAGGKGCDSVSRMPSSELLPLANTP